MRTIESDTKDIVVYTHGLTEKKASDLCASYGIIDTAYIATKGERVHILNPHLCLDIKRQDGGKDHISLNSQNGGVRFWNAYNAESAGDLEGQIVLCLTETDNLWHEPLKGLAVNRNLVCKKKKEK